MGVFHGTVGADVFGAGGVIINLHPAVERFFVFDAAVVPLGAVWCSWFRNAGAAIGAGWQVWMLIAFGCLNDF